MVRKPSGGWRFTIDYRALNKVITNEGWQIPNMKDMLQRIGSLKPRVFGVADLTPGFYQMPLHKDCWAATAFISFRGIYEWTRVPMGLLPSANFFQKSMSVHIFNGPLYRTCEVYIDDLLFHGQNDEDFIINTRQIFQICREKGVILSAKKLVIGMSSVPFVGHEVDSVGLNMTQARIESTVAFTKPGTLKELSSFLGVVNYFRDHMRNHSQHSHSLNEMVATANKHATKTIIWTTEGLQGFEKLKAMVNACPKLYFINNAYKVVLYTDASDYAQEHTCVIWRGG